MAAHHSSGSGSAPPPGKSVTACASISPWMIRPSMVTSPTFNAVVQRSKARMYESLPASPSCRCELSVDEIALPGEACAKLWRVARLGRLVFRPPEGQQAEAVCRFASLHEGTTQRGGIDYGAVRARGLRLSGRAGWVLQRFLPRARRLRADR